MKSGINNSVNVYAKIKGVRIAIINLTKILVNVNVYKKRAL